MKVLAFCNQKGGTGKTTIAAHVAVGLAIRGHSVLAVDLDGQANLTKWLVGAETREKMGGAGVTRVLRDGAFGPPDICRVGLTTPLYVLPVLEPLAAAEVDCLTTPAGQTHLRRALRAHAKEYDFVVLDCGPSLGVAVVSGLCAADSVYVPVLPGVLSISGLADLEQTVQRLRVGFNVPTRVRGYVLFNVDSREAMSVATRRSLRKHGKAPLLKSEIRVSTAASWLPERHQTAWNHGADPRGAKDYAALVKELVRMEKA